MERRVYGLPGKTSGIIQIPVGKASLQVEFSKGCSDRKYYRPALYSTSDPVIQRMIEDSILFAKGTIVLWKVYNLGGDPEPVKAASQTQAKEATVVETPAAEAGKSYPEIVSFTDAVTLLKGMGVPASSLRSKDAAKEAAAELGISFPNLK